MAKQVGTINNISEQKVAANGNKYSTVETTLGSFNVFDVGMLMKLEPDKDYLIEYETKGKFKNLVGFEPVNSRANDVPSERTSSGFTSIGNLMNKYKKTGEEVKNNAALPTSYADGDTETRRTDSLNLVVDLISNCPTVLDNVFLSSDNVELGLKIAHTADILNYYLAHGRDENMREAQQVKNPDTPEVLPEIAPEVIRGEEIEEREAEQKKMEV